MATCQCPNCGGFKTYSWKSAWIVDGIARFLPAFMIAGVSIYWDRYYGLILLGVVVAVLVLWKGGEYLLERPKGGSHVCEICNYSFNPGDRPATATADAAALRAMGEALLEAQRAQAEAAAAQEEQERRDRERSGH